MPSRTPYDSVQFEVSGDDLDEAADFFVKTMQGLVAEREARGFTAPVLTAESFELVEGKWTRVFTFSAEFLPLVS